MTMITDLPRDLLKEIVSRVPLKSIMMTVRLACKTWNRLTKSESFRKIHMGRAAATTREGESQMIVMMDYNLYLVSVFVNDPSIEIIGKLTCLNEQVKISQVFHCEGLLLCILEEDDTKVMVWNPYLGQTRWIESRYSHGPDGWDGFSYALGYEDKKSCRSHKILRFIDKYYMGARAPEDQFFWYEIYDFDSGLWTTLDVTPYWRKLFGSRGVSLKGNTYWPASQRDSEDERDGHIICFDFTSERFGPLLRLPFNSRDGDYVTLSCFREEKLAVLLTHNEVNRYELDIWITTKVEAENVSWSKFLTLNTYPEYPISSTFFIDEEKKVAMGVNREIPNRYSLSIIGEAGYFKVLDLGEHADSRCWGHACSYVPSLVQIKQSTGGKRKQQSDLEKRQYDENMLRLVALEKRFRM